MKDFDGVKPNTLHVVSRNLKRLTGLLTCCALLFALPGCVSKATAKKQAHEAFMAGQQQAMMRMQQQQQQQQAQEQPTGQAQPQLLNPPVTIMGNVKNPSIPWTPGLTLAKAIVQAQYTGSGDPTEIYLMRGGIVRPVDVGKLIAGQDIPLQAGDTVQIK